MREAVIVEALRTPVGRAEKGSLASVRSDDLGALVVKALMARVPEVKPDEIEDLIMGCSHPEGEQGMNVGRMIVFMAGLPVEVPGATVNRFCASSLESINMAAQQVITGQSDIVIAGGLESMSHVPMGGKTPKLNVPLMKSFPNAYATMGQTAENVAEKFGISRVDQDEYGYQSHVKAVKARNEGKFDAELVPVEVVNEDGSKVVVTRDDGPRPDTTIEKMATLKPSFKSNGTVTAGNSSPRNDGAAAVLVMEKSLARARGLKPLATIRAAAVAGVPPEIMGVGPIFAVRKLLKKTGMTLDRIDIIELNEAFASQALACIRELGIDKLDMNRLNMRGGAIAIGHPLGATGARIMATLLHEMKDMGARWGLETLCVGGGMGMAMLLEREE